jgi:hypothetical protein
LAYDPLNPQATPVARLRTAWGHGAAQTQGNDPRGAAAHTNIGSHERIAGSAHRQANLDAGVRGERAPGGPKGPNAPPAAKQPKGH